jgi:hypothetical protein
MGGIDPMALLVCASHKAPTFHYGNINVFHLDCLPFRCQAVNADAGNRTRKGNRPLAAKASTFAIFVTSARKDGPQAELTENLPEGQILFDFVVAGVLISHKQGGVVVFH